VSRDLRARFLPRTARAGARGVPRATFGGDGRAGGGAAVADRPASRARLRARDVSRRPGVAAAPPPRTAGPTDRGGAADAADPAAVAAGRGDRRGSGWGPERRG